MKYFWIFQILVLILAISYLVIYTPYYYKKRNEPTTKEFIKKESLGLLAFSLNFIYSLMAIVDLIFILSFINV